MLGVVPPSCPPLGSQHSELTENSSPITPRLGRQGHGDGSPTLGILQWCVGDRHTRGMIEEPQGGEHLGSHKYSSGPTQASLNPLSRRPQPWPLETTDSHHN